MGQSPVTDDTYTPLMQPHPSASWQSPAKPTGRLRFFDGELQAEWLVQWDNEMGGGEIKEWFSVPKITSS
jgi:hypothetical protein